MTARSMPSVPHPAHRGLVPPPPPPPPPFLLRCPTALSFRLCSVTAGTAAQLPARVSQPACVSNRVNRRISPQDLLYEPPFHTRGVEVKATSAMLCTVWQGRMRHKPLHSKVTIVLLRVGSERTRTETRRPRAIPPEYLHKTEPSLADTVRLGSGTSAALLFARLGRIWGCTHSNVPITSLHKCLRVKHFNRGFFIQMPPPCLARVFTKPTFHVAVDLFQNVRALQNHQLCLMPAVRALAAIASFVSSSIRMCDIARRRR
jgi:hypothetical protein